MHLPEAHVLGVRVHPVSAAVALAAIDRMLQDGKGHQVVTLNPEMVVRAAREPCYRSVLNRADLATVDGAGILLALALLRGRRARRLTGADLVPESPGWPSPPRGHSWRTPPGCG